MPSTDSNDNTTATPVVTPNSPEIVLDLETQKLFIAQENIPAACEESKHLNQLQWNRSNARLSIIRIVAVLFILAIALITAITAVCSGDLTKLSSAAVSLYNVAQTLALHHNGTSASS
jgi:hypothetical protein